MNTTIKIFLALSNDLKEESLELSDLVEHLNLILEPQDIHIYLSKWNYLENSLEENSLVHNYDKALDESEICMVVFGKDFNSFTEEELRKAYSRVCNEDIMPEKLYVYFKSIEEATTALKSFKNSFADKYGHFAGIFKDANALKNDFLLQFQLFQNSRLNNQCPVEIKDSKVTLSGKDLFIELGSLPYLSNNETYNDILKNIKKTKKFLTRLEPEDEDYAELASDLNNLEEKKQKIEKSIWATAVEIANLSNQKCSERIKKAIELFNSGDNKGADAILNTQEILNDAENNLKLKKLFEEGLKTNIMELRLKARVLENEINDGWGLEVKKIYEKIIEYTKEVYGPTSKEYVEALRDASSKLGELDYFEDSLRLEEEALEIWQKDFSNEKLTLADIFLDIAWIYNQLGRVMLSYQHIQKAIDIKKRELGENHIQTIWAYKTLCSFFNSNSYNEAYEVAGKLLKWFEEHPDIDDIDKAKLYETIAMALLVKSNYEEALELQKKSYDLLVKIYGENNYLLYYSYGRFSKIYSSMGDYDKANEYNFKALPVIRKKYGELHTDTAGAYESIAYNYKKASDYKNALHYMLKSYRIKKEILGELHPDTISDLETLGDIYKDLKEFEKSLDCYLKLLNLEKERHGEFNYQTDYVYTKIENLYEAWGNKSKALEWRLKKIDIDFNIHQSYGIFTSDPYRWTANDYAKLGMDKEAQECYLKSLESDYRCLRECIESNPDKVYLKRACELGKDFSENGNPGREKDCEKLAFDLLVTNYGESEETLPLIYARLGDNYHEVKDYNKGLRYKIKALDLYEKTHKEPDTYTASIYNSLSCSYRELGEIQKANHSVLRALEISSNLPETKPQDLAIFYNEAATNLIEMEDYPKVLEFLDKAFNIAKELNNKELEAISLNRMGRTYAAMGDKAMAKSKFEEAMPLVSYFHEVAIDCRERLWDLD